MMALLMRKASTQSAMLAISAGMAMGLAACSGTGLTGSAPAPEAAPTAASAAPSDIAGRWALTAGGATCAMNLTPATGPAEGGVRPEGGCAGNFYTTRKWTFESGSLILRDHNGKPLAQMKLLAQGRFEGQSTAGGQAVSLVR
jgi:hypothetical protein